MVFAIVSAILFFVLLNISFFVNEGKIKNILENGNFYDNIAFYIKNEIVTKSDFKLNEGNNFEDLNQNVNADKIKITINNGLHDIFSSLENPNNSEKIFPVKFSSENTDGTKFYFEKYFNIQDNPVLELLSEKNTILLIIGGLSLLLLLFGMLFFLKNPKGGLMYLGVFALSTTFVLAIIAILLKLFASEYMQTFANNVHLFRDAKLLSILKRILSVIVSNQFYYYLIEIISLFVLAITFFSLRRMIVREDLQEIDKKI